MEAAGIALRDFDLFIPQLFVGLIRSGEFKRVGDDCFPVLHTSDDVRTPDPVRLFVISLRPLGWMIWMGVIKTHNVFPPVATFTLDSHQFLRIDVVAIVSRVGTGVAAASSVCHDPRTVILKSTKEHSAALVWVGFFAVTAKSFVVRAR